MIDHILHFTNELAAQADSVVGRYYHLATQGHDPSPGSWDLSRCIPNLFIYAPASDTSATVTTPKGTATVVTHHAIDTLWRICISLPAVDLTLKNHANMGLVADRDAAAAGQPFIIASAMTDAQLNALNVQPQFAGSNYPFGAAR